MTEGIVKNTAVKKDPRFEHIMALSLDKHANCETGVIRCITSRAGDVAERGHINKSELYKVEKVSGYTYKITSLVQIAGQEGLAKSMYSSDYHFLGIEDPDIWYEESTSTYHLYFTLPFRNAELRKTLINLGHACGKSLDSLEMTPPVLSVGEEGMAEGAKELAIAPVNRNGVRLNLVESSRKVGDTKYSTVRIAIAEDMSRDWVFGDHILNPSDYDLAWVGGHASPGPFFSQGFIDVGDGKLLGVLNGREANRQKDGKTVYGRFSVGLYIYDYEKGIVDWVSETPFIDDEDARTITFASDLVETSNEEALLFAHVDDSFVRSYRVSSDMVKGLIP